MMADVNLFGGQEEQLKVVLLVGWHVVVHVIVYYKLTTNVLWTLLRLVKIICTLQINWVLTTAQQGTLFRSGCKMAKSKPDDKVVHTMLLSLVQWMKIFEKLHWLHHSQH